jgi:basic amino acid/polyamine antiporter, APA family
VARELGGFTCLAIGLTTIVGSGIFALPPLLAAGLGPMSFLAFVGAAILVSLIGLMTAEAAGTTDRHGGTYQYVSMAFGKVPGFAVAWLSWINNMLSWATVSLALVKLVEVVAPSLGDGYFPQLLATTEIVAFGVLNAMGVRPGAAVSNALTIGKLVPLFLFVVIGFLAFQPGSFAGSTDTLAAAGASTFAVAVYRCIFAAGGFENVGVIAGDVKNPQKVIPRAVLLAIAASTVLYALVQIAAVSSVPELATLAPDGKPGSLALPLAGERAATHLAGAGFGAVIYGIILVGAVVSMVGYCAGVAIVAPRYLFALAEDGFVPARLVKRDRRGTPVIAVLVATTVAVIGVWTLDWITLLDASVLFSLVQHSATTAAAWKLRRTVPAAGRFIAPGGPLVPATALALVVALCVFAAAAPPGQGIDAKHVFAITMVTGLGFATWGLATIVKR